MAPPISRCLRGLGALSACSGRRAAHGPNPRTQRKTDGSFTSDFRSHGPAAPQADIEEAAHALESRARGARSTGRWCYGYTSANEPVEEEAAVVRATPPPERRAAARSSMRFQYGSGRQKLRIVLSLATG